MSRRRLRASLAFVSALLPAAAGLAIQLLPLQGAPQSDGPGVEVKSAVEVLHRTGVEYPSGALKAGIGGDVVVDVRVNSKGEVTSAAPVSGPEALREALLRSVANWHFDALRGLPEHFEVAARFTPPRQGPSAGDARPIRAVNLDQVPPALRDRVSEAVTIRPGETPDMARIAENARALRAVDEHLTMGEVRRGGERDLFVAIGPQKPASPVEFKYQGAMHEYAGAPLDPDVKRLTIGGDKAAMKLTFKVAPIYPPLAKQARVQGIVRLQAVIDKDGKVKNLQLVSGHPLLIQSAVDAVQQWMYEPTLLNGDPVEIITTIDVNYTLAP